MRTNTAEIDSTIIHPGSVKINVKGAFIVDQDSGSPNGSTVHANGGSYDTNDIRLPNHTAVVSHIAIDVSLFTSSLSHT
jgi:type II pantothenate kinase